MRIFYGLSNKRQIVELAELTCNTLGNGSNNKAVHLLVETCAAETLLGCARDNTVYGAGTGVAQVDQGTFDWLQDKYGKVGSSKHTKIFEAMNIKLDRVQYQELEYSPLLCLIFARLRYMTVSAPIPDSIEERARYWKTHYNTVEGKGTPDEYLSRCKSSGVASVMEHCLYE